MSYTATLSEITRVRLLTGENTDNSDYSEELISGFIADRNGDLYAAAADIWRCKAAVLAANPTSFSADGGTYNFEDAYNRCISEAERCESMSPSMHRMIIDPTLEPVEE